MTHERLDERTAAAVLASAESLQPRRSERRELSRIEGIAPLGAAVSVELREPTLVLVVAARCDGCADLIDLVARGVEGARVLGVLGSDPEPSDEEVARICARGDWVRTDAPQRELGIFKGPYYCVVVDGIVELEGVAIDAAAIERDVARVLRGERLRDGGRL